MHYKPALALFQLLLHCRPRKELPLSDSHFSAKILALIQYANYRITKRY